jgi:Phasin protein
MQTRVTRNQNFAQQQNGKEQIDTGTASSNIPGGFQAIASAYGDYTKKSIEDTKVFVEKLSGVRSLDKAIEVQTEFAKTAYETFVTESQKIGALYSNLYQAVLQLMELEWQVHEPPTIRAASIGGLFHICSTNPNSAGCKRHDGQTSDSGCARPSHRSRRGSPVG